MRIADIVLRRGHLSEDALVDAWYSGVHPAHLDRCDLCTERALTVSRWLDETRKLGLESADEAFPAERLAAQQHQILDRLEQLDRPSKLLAFPRVPATPAVASTRQVSSRWLVAAAAAGLVLGVIGGRLSVWQPSPAPARAATSPARTPAAPAATAPATPADDFMMYDGEISAPSISSLRALDTLTPPVSVARVSTTQR